MSWIGVGIGVSSIAGAYAANKAADTQAAAGQASIKAQQAAQEEAARLQEPYRQFGLGQMGAYNQQMGTVQNLFGQGAQDYIQNPVVQDIINQERQKILQNQAISGRLGTGETPDFLQQSALRTGLGLLQNERQQQLGYANSLLSPIQLGQAAASGQASGALQSGANIGNTLTGIGNAQAAGQVGVANALTGGLQNYMLYNQLGSFGGFGSAPSYGPVPTVPGVNTIPGMY